MDSILDELIRDIYNDSADPSVFFVVSLSVACDPSNPVQSRELEHFGAAYFMRFPAAAKA